jgi:aminoglycoside phosphotransferase (APT) family kinase protein
MPYPTETILRIAAHHGIRGPVSLMPASGMVNEAWMLDERFVLRINIVDDADDEPPREGWVVPLVREHGIRSPELVAVDLSRELIDRLYTIYAKAEGELLGHIEREPSDFGPSFRELGREIAALNKIHIPAEKVTQLREGSTFDAEEQLEKSASAGKLTQADVREIEAMIRLLEPYRAEDVEKKFLHQDIHPWNMFVDRDSRELTAIIDWGDAAWGDPAAEFASMPLAALQEMFSGYEEAGGNVDVAFRARSLSLGLALSLWELRDLDPNRFMRRWWRHPIGGFEETRRVVECVLYTPRG